MWQEFLDSARAEFSDVPSIRVLTQILIRLVLAALLGGALGFERERAGKSAGARTHMLVSLGAALFVLAPLQAEMLLADVSRVLQGIITGVGFLGAGAILKQVDQEEVKGLTTAAGIWLTAGIGVTAGLGREVTAIIATLLALFILHVMYRMEKLAAQLNVDSAPK